MDEERFIIEVEKHTILYDITHQYYKDNVRKDKAWCLVGGVIGVEVDVCKAKWKSLRDAFVKTRKKSIPSGSAGGSQKAWKYSDIMSFVLPYIQQRSSKSSLGDPSQLEEIERASTPGAASGSSGPPTPTPPTYTHTPTNYSSPTTYSPTTSGTHNLCREEAL
ncbi:Transcription factor Adf-1 [Dissostichus eleginoides]|uniref:Transcription factor Adf-1 n=1 Tax=Dissostichus eleginoides TaxID=100907 RepID=A0AAD9CHP8_DISEL|nr:Transcription factor Adf-1 [Dissostichus eleginoides]